MSSNVTMKKICLFLAVASILYGAQGFSSECNLSSYQKVISGCFSGRAEGFGLPGNYYFGGYSGLYNSMWDQGAYNSEYKGISFTPNGAVYQDEVSTLPPYSWGAIGQVCDIEHPRDEAIYEECTTQVSLDLKNPEINASYAPGKYYWKSHGHNCHDAAEDVGSCLLNAATALAACSIDVRVVVWDVEPDVTKALGNVYHSQLLVKRLMNNSSTGKLKEMVCLEESEVGNPAGTTYESCCTENLKLMSGGSIEEYVDAFGSCGNLFFTDSSIHPHTYDVANFKSLRQSGPMDVLNSYDRMAGVKALSSIIPNVRLGGAPPNPKIVRVAYDKNGIAVMLNVK